MTVVPTTASLATAPTWDGDRRVAGGALAGDPPALEGNDELTFGDFISVINPLQHIPVVSTLYRWFTGDTIKPAARVVGGALYGGPVGLVSAAFNAIVEEVKGKDIGAQIVSLFSPDKPAGQADSTAVAAAAPDSQPDAQPAAGDSNAAALQQLAADLRAQAATAEAAKPAALPAAAPVLPNQTRSLAFYQANAGQRLATVDSGRNGPAPKFNLAMFQNGPTSPMSKPLPLPAAEDKSGTADPGMPQQAPADAWFSSAMMRGLDRYRATQQLGKPPSPQLDVLQ
jgi:hypothetical protein